jgi:hypothetical protein
MILKGRASKNMEWLTQSIFTSMRQPEAYTLLIKDGVTMLFLQIKNKTLMIKHWAKQEKQFSGKATHNYLHLETEPFRVLLIHWRNNKQLLIVEITEPASSPHSGKAPPWWQKSSEPSLDFTTTWGEREKWLWELPRRLRSNNSPVKLFHLAFLFLPPPADRSLTIVLKSC